MKKLMLIAASALFMITGCDENKAEKTADVKTAAPVVNQTAPAAQPAAEQNVVKSVDWDKALEMNAELRGQYESDPQVRHLIDMCRKLEGLPRHT
jgi:DNA polymerase III alpha subunit